jgi:predicted nucleic acid-binding protein
LNRYFLDSSAFAKLFVAESGTDRLVELVRHCEDRHRMISILADIEVRSAIRRRQASGDIALRDAESALASLTQEARCIVQQPLSRPVIVQSVAIIDRQTLRALDAIQLASALVVHKTLKPHDSLVFVASDKRLLDAATAEGLSVWDPSAAEAIPGHN